MPQLNPGPWFSIFILSWMIFTISTVKTSKHAFPNNPAPKHLKNNNFAWTWPWL